MPLAPAPSPRRRPRAGHTLPELAVALAILGVLASLALVRAGRLLDRAGARAAIADVAAVLAAARDAAVALGASTVVRLSGDGVVATVGTDTLARRAVSTLHGATLEATRDSLAWSPIGLATGAANLRVIARRGSAADTLTVSRLGRVRW